MFRRIPFLAWVMFLTLPPGMALSQAAADKEDQVEKPKREDRTVSRCLRILQRELSREVEILSTFIKLDQAGQENLKKRLRSLVESESKRAAKEGSFPAGPASQELTPALAKQLRKLVQTGTDAAGFRAWDEDLSMRRKFWQDAGVEAYVTFIDHEVALTSKQAAQVDRLARTLTKRRPLKLDLLILKPRELPGRKPLTSVLTATQTVQLKNSKTAIGRNALNPAALDRETRRKTLVQEMKGIASRQIDCLRRECALTLEQVKRLEIAAKGAIDGVVDSKLDAEANLQKSMEDGRMDPRLIDKATVPPTKLLLVTSRWRAFVLAALTPDQKTVFKRADVERTRRVRSTVAAYLTASVSKELPGNDALPLNARQQNALFHLIRNVLPQGVMVTDSNRAVLQLALITDDQYTTAIGKSNLDRLRPILTVLRGAEQFRK